MSPILSQPDPTINCTPSGIAYLVNILRSSPTNPFTPSIFGDAHSGVNTTVDGSTVANATGATNGDVNLSTLRMALPTIPLAPAPGFQANTPMMAELRQLQSRGLHLGKRPIKFTRVWSLEEPHMTDFCNDVSKIHCIVLFQNKLLQLELQCRVPFRVLLRLPLSTSTMPVNPFQFII